MQLVNNNLKHRKTTGQTYTYSSHKDDKGNIITASDELVWAEKYRPRIIDDLILPKDTLATIKNIIDKQEIPNMLLYSVSGGLGKDSIISVITNEVPCTLLTINASLHRDINTIRTQVIEFASRKSLDGTHKIIYLNEVGGLTKIALDSLKAVIEDFSTHVSFLMTTNSMSNISHPLQSRFQFFDMDVLPKEEKKELISKAFMRVKMILELESVTLDLGKVKQLLLKYFPRYRDLMIALQKASVGGELLSVQQDLELLPTILGHINKTELVDIIKLSEVIDIYTFIHEMNKNLLAYVEKLDDLPEIIEQLNDLQVSFNNRIPFPNISFILFCQNLMMEKITFNIPSDKK